MQLAIEADHVIGVDPGLACCAFAVVAKVGDEFHLVDHGLLKTSPKTPLADRLAEIYAFGLAAAQDNPGCHAVVEESVVGPGRRSALKLAEARGAVIAGIAVGGASKVSHIAPASIKRIVAGKGTADKRQLDRNVRRILHFNGKWSSHESDAAAIALTGLLES